MKKYILHNKVSSKYHVSSIIVENGEVIKIITSEVHKPREFTSAQAKTLLAFLVSDLAPFWAKNYEMVEVMDKVKPKTCDGKVVKMKDDDGVEREYKLTLVKK